MEDKLNNRGYLYPNENKTMPNHPDFKGKIRVDGKDRWISGWFGTDTRGKEKVSLQTTDVDQQPVRQTQQAPAPSLKRMLQSGTPKQNVTSGKAVLEDDEIPFD